MIRTLDCEHKFCSNCLKDYITLIIENNKLEDNVCPAGCGKPIDHYIIEDIVDEEVRLKYEKFNLYNLEKQN